MTPARRHYMKTVAAMRKKEEQAAAPSAAASAYELMLAKLAQDKHDLRSIQSLEARIPIKEKKIPDYMSWVEGVLKGKSGVQDDVFMTVLVWMLDVGDLKGALPLIEYTLLHEMRMPDQYDRTTGCFIAETAAEVAQRAMDAGKEVDLDSLQQIRGMTDDEDMPDPVRVKLYKVLGKSLMQIDRQEALRLLRRALELNPRCGVKKDVDNLEKALRSDET